MIALAGEVNIGIGYYTILLGSSEMLLRRRKANIRRVVYNWSRYKTPYAHDDKKPTAAPLQ
jgi:hypothetical protein